MRNILPFAMILVFNPRPNKPMIPSEAITDFAAPKYEIGLSYVCRTVFTTRILLVMVSETADAANPMPACLSSFCALVCPSGTLVCKKLYVPNQGRCPARFRQTLTKEKVLRTRHSSSRRRQRSMPQYCGPRRFDLGDQVLQTSRDLHGSLHGINWHQEDAKASSDE